MANAGNYAIGIGGGAASGAGIGSLFGPIGAGIGAGLGAGVGALSTLLSSSDDAKKRRLAKEQLMEQERQRLEKESEQRYAAITGINRDPMFQVLSAERWDPAKASKQADDYLAGAMPEQQPNYGALVQSLGSLGSTVGGLARADQLANLRNQSNQLGNIRATGNPWANYALGDQSDALDELLNDARDKAWAKTGGW